MFTTASKPSKEGINYDTPELYDDIINISTAIPPTDGVAIVNSNVVIEAVNGTVVTLTDGGLTIDANGWTLEKTTFRDIVGETHTPVMQSVTIGTPAEIVNANGGYIIDMTQTGNTTLTLIPASTDADKYTILTFRRTAAAVYSLAMVDGYVEGGVAPTLSSTAGTYDTFTCLYLGNIAKWLVVVSEGYAIPAAAQSTSRMNKTLAGGKVAYAKEFPKQSLSAEPLALEVNQECAVDSNGQLVSTSILYDKTANLYTNRVRASLTQRRREGQLNVVAASTPLNLDYALGNIFFMEHTADIGSVNILNVPPSGATTDIILIRRQPNDTTPRTITFSASYVGEVASSPVYTYVPNAIDIIYFSTTDGITFETNIKNDFRAAS